jgi:hypothetical protein
MKSVRSEYHEITSVTLDATTACTNKAPVASGEAEEVYFGSDDLELPQTLSYPLPGLELYPICKGTPIN